MSIAATGASEGLALAVGILVLSGYYAIRQWMERRDRPDSLSPEDARYFARKDVRRLANSAILTAIALGIAFGSRIDPRAGRLQRRLFVATWLAVFLLLLAVVALAFIDLLATRIYATRHRQALADERLSLEYELQRYARQGEDASGGDR